MSTTYRRTGFRKRVFTYAYCRRTEVDYVCQKCMSISVDGRTCQHCATVAEKQAERLREFLAQRGPLNSK